MTKGKFVIIYPMFPYQYQGIESVKLFIHDITDQQIILGTWKDGEVRKYEFDRKTGNSVYGFKISKSDLEAINRGSNK